MGRVYVIARREVGALFYSPIAYFVLFLFLLVTGFLFGSLVFVPGQLSEVRQLVEYLRFGLFFIVPGITMSLLADEYRSGRIEMLRTSPITELDLVLGKYLGAMLFYIILLASSFIYVALLVIWGRPDWGQTFSAYLGLLLLGMMFVSIGLFFSTCTKDQIVAYLATMLVLGFMTFASGLSTLVPKQQWFIPLRAPINYLGVWAHISDFSRGVVDTEHLVYFLGFTLLFLFLTYLIVESRKWQ
ncbi:MAG TPA: ABC transporter permease [Phycisphaerae bacterium]|nr:ABC transporter permease [Phycisphaerae bacterium]